MATMLPRELVEQILSYCDGYTLYRARGVCKLWKQSADYLIQKNQLWVCCQREMGAATLDAMAASDCDCDAQYRAWYRHSLLGGWPVVQMPPLALPEEGVLAVACIDGDCMVMAATADGVGLFDLFGHLAYMLPHCTSSFPIRQLEITRPLPGLDDRRMLVIAYSNNIVRVCGLWHDDVRSSMSPLVPLMTREGHDITVNASEDLVCVSYPNEAWLYLVRVGRLTVRVDILCVVELSSSGGLGHDGTLLRTAGCSRRAALSRPILPADGDSEFRPIRPEDIRDLHFNAANFVASLGTGAEVVVGHAELGSRTLDAFMALRSRVSACLLHGRLMAHWRCISSPTSARCCLSTWPARLAVSSSLPSPLLRLRVIDQAETVRVFAHDAAGCLHHCYWRRPGAGYRPSHDPAEPLLTRWINVPRETAGGRW
ncbi:hypothetical protein FJT64_027375 [Amphibalanus amphitrite]|uniref:F-box domain-containing protein n=1 Tax=Amphibalanus amphitrite TaxID=1232801 RepID=A0A6A4WDL0_AMPAM|nr:hypothetical protein FJT64_027375 [Amphibalanus amphitrite]KAF0300052.1 hypothetical protein FJT64_027375 [Amphibalanus amphitrite]